MEKNSAEREACARIKAVHWCAQTFLDWYSNHWIHWPKAPRSDSYQSLRGTVAVKTICGCSQICNQTDLSQDNEWIQCSMQVWSNRCWYYDAKASATMTGRWIWHQLSWAGQGNEAKAYKHQNWYAEKVNQIQVSHFNNIDREYEIVLTQKLFLSRIYAPATY
jgi:hypothetical protein